MPRPILPFDINQYTIPQRVAMLAEIWESVIDESTEMPLTREQIDEVDRLLAVCGARPEETARWEAVKARAFRKTG